MRIADNRIAGIGIADIIGTAIVGVLARAGMAQLLTDAPAAAGTKPTPLRQPPR